MSNLFRYFKLCFPIPEMRFSEPARWTAVIRKKRSLVGSVANGGCWWWSEAAIEVDQMLQALNDGPVQKPTFAFLPDVVLKRARAEKSADEI